MSEINNLKFGVSQGKDIYLMDMENQALNDWKDEIPKNRERIYNKEWLKHIEKYVDKHNGIEYAMNLYINWVKAGGGDDWFVDSDEEQEEETKTFTEGKYYSIYASRDDDSIDGDKILLEKETNKYYFFKYNDKMIKINKTKYNDNLDIIIKKKCKIDKRYYKVYITDKTYEQFLKDVFGINGVINV